MWSREGWEQEEQKTKGGCAASILEGASSPGSGKRKLLPVVLGHLCSVSLQAAQRKLRQASTNVKHWNVQMNRLMHPIEPGGRRPSPWHAAQCCCWFSCPVLFFGTLGEDRQLFFFKSVSRQTYKHEWRRFCWLPTPHVPERFLPQTQTESRG